MATIVTGTVKIPTVREVTDQVPGEINPLGAFSRGYLAGATAMRERIVVIVTTDRIATIADE